MDKKQLMEYEKYKTYYNNLFEVIKNEKITPQLVGKSHNGKIKYLRIFVYEEEFDRDITKDIKGIMSIFFNCKIKVNHNPIRVYNQQDAISYILDFLKTKVGEVNNGGDNNNRKI